MGLKFNWVSPSYSEEEIKNLKNTYNLTDMQAKFLLARNIKKVNQIKEYLIGDYDEGFDPFLMSDMQIAVERIHKAIENEEKILVYGDYDADGITSTVLLLETLLSLGANASSYIPNRFTEGYGPNKEAFKNIIESGISLIITVDNGIAGVEEVDYANSIGCDVIITDHHKIQDRLPNAYAIIHPEHPDFNYPFCKLAGVGVAFKLAHALLDIYPDFLLDLVAIGTVADLVPIVSENRFFVKQGLNLLNEDTRIGLKFLLDISNHYGNIDEDTISFIIAPRLNSIGRISSARDGLLLLSTDDNNTAYELAKKVDSFNIERKKITEDIVNDINKKIKNDKRNLLVIYEEGYHEGVLGIVASNISEKYKKPVLVMNRDNNKLKGSARSIYNFNIYEAMNKINTMFTAFGGHSMAAGFSTSVEFIDEIDKSLNEEYNNYLSNFDFKLEKNVDLKIDYNNISYQLINELDKFKPFGMNFEKPVIVVENINVLEKIEFGANNQYLKLLIGNNNNKIECISFKDNEIFKEINSGDIINIMFNLNKNYFNGRTKLQINLIDIEKKDYIFRNLTNNNLDFNSFPKNELKISRNYNDTINNYYLYKDLHKINQNFDIINILELPNNKQFIFDLLNLNPKKVNICCLEGEAKYKKYRIDKEKLIKFYNIILKIKTLNLNTKESISKMINLLETNIASLKIMIQIFIELNLIKLDKNIIYLLSDNTDVDLKISKTYNAMIERFEIEKLLLEEDISTINNYFM
ncbi:single-stranded-DNA-specific exonuclease RecJ [Gemella sp. zg-570]|uniref:single-stranded-DNA-specific exonuclease RecJ n=1 Tax=Gemella sp. zg-570 TaxID=2840371 RepID=UPI001C0CB088|nr:single-stranded-DNA-specific exonuclease RecJ [Gemella sp. zg-570]QWQ39437.1 single-stranded-DNA-specific exonuclease RecJ [Gemella sp. zg-570]